MGRRAVPSIRCSVGRQVKPGDVALPVRRARERFRYKTSPGKHDIFSPEIAARLMSGSRFLVTRQRPATWSGGPVGF